MTKIAKIDEAQGLVYGWASVAGLEDSQGDVIEPAELEKAAVSFMLNHRAVGEMHQGTPTGSIVESVVMSPEKLSAMGFPEELAKSARTALWVGVKLDPKGETFQKVKDGTYTMFSIQGRGKQVAV